MAEGDTKLNTGAWWSMLDNLTQQVLSFLVFMALARLVAPQEFGLIALAHVMVSFVRQTVLDAIVHPVARASEPSESLYSTAFFLCIAASLLMGGLMLLLARPLARWYALPDLAAVVAWMSLAVLATGASAVFEIRLVRQMEFKPLALRSMVSVTMGGAVGIALALRGAGVMALVAQQVVTSAVALALLVVQSRWRPQWPRQRPPLRSLMHDASRVGMTGFFGFLGSQGDTVLVSLLLGAHATGLYSFAKRLTSAIYLVIASSLLKLAIPAFAQAHGDPQALQRAYVRVLGTTTLLMAPLLVGLSLLAPNLVSVFFGDAWMGAVPVVALLAALYLLLAATQVNDYLLFAVGARSVPMQRSLLQIVLAMLLGWLGARFGLVGVASGFVMAALLVWPWMQRIANRHMKGSAAMLLRTLGAPAASAIAMGLVLVALRQRLPVGVPSLVGLTLLGALVYGGLHWLLVRLWPASHDALRSLLHLPDRNTLADVLPLAGYPVQSTTSALLQQQLEDRLEGGLTTVLVFANTNFVMQCQSLRQWLGGEHVIIVNDGVGMDIAALVRHGQRYRDNLNGTDFVPRFLRGLGSPKRVFLLGGRPGIADTAAAALLRGGRCTLAGTQDGYSMGTPEELRERINASGADIVLVALGNPLQEIWIRDNLAALKPRLFISVGALFDFLSGSVARAPVWVRRMRLEWCFRLLREPRRMGRRYTVDVLRFMVLCLRASR
jgi:exopolysaccharide biosynthesis WecB/TagA/CpsF family protein